MILLDTHVLFWAVNDTKQLSKPAVAAILKAQTDGGLSISAISLWELAMLLARGRIQGYGTVEASLRLLTEDVIIKPITSEIASIAAQFPMDFPRDPADRIIGATAKAEGLPLITRDEKLKASPLLQTIW
jgi:PIN domain nuclease of toxin-antitoxin system